MTFAPTTLEQSFIYPVGNYGTNAGPTNINSFQYQGSIYTTGNSLFQPIPFYPTVSPLISRPLVTDSPGPTKSLIMYGNATVGGLPTIYVKNAGNTAYVNNGQSLNAGQNFVSYRSATLKAGSTATPVWGDTTATYPNLYFREVGVYIVTCNIACTGFGDLIYNTIHLNYAVGSPNPAVNNYNTILCTNQTVNGAYTALATAIVNVTVCGTTASPESGDFLVFGFFTSKAEGGNTIFDGFRNQLLIYKIA